MNIENELKLITAQIALEEIELRIAPDMREVAFLKKEIINRLTTKLHEKIRETTGLQIGDKLYINQDYIELKRPYFSQHTLNRIAGTVGELVYISLFDEEARYRGAPEINYAVEVDGGTAGDTPERIILSMKKDYEKYR